MGWPKGKKRKAVEYQHSPTETPTVNNLTYQVLSEVGPHSPSENDECRAGDDVITCTAKVLDVFDPRVADPRAPSAENNNNTFPQSTPKFQKALLTISTYTQTKEEECVCWHCRTFTSRVKVALRKIMEAENADD